MSSKKFFIMLTWLLTLHHVVCNELVNIGEWQRINVYDYSGYEHVSVIHFNIPANQLLAVFRFTAKVEKSGLLGECPVRNISVYLKPGNIPLVNPDGSKIGTNLLKNRRENRNFTFLSDTLNENEVSTEELKRPMPISGDWYMIAFHSWIASNSEQITQADLVAKCTTIMDVKLLVQPVSQSRIVDNAQNYTIALNNTVQSYAMQFIVPEDVHIATVFLKLSCKDCQVLAQVMTTEVLEYKNVTSSDRISLSFRPYTNTIHNLVLQVSRGKDTNVDVQFPQKDVNTTVQYKKLNKVSLSRRMDMENYFTFDFEHMEKNATQSSPVNVTANNLTLLSFQLESNTDTGGTLVVGLNLPNKTVNIAVVGCISLGYYADVTSTGRCTRQVASTDADLWVNDTKIPSMIYIPYPEPGIWHLSLKAFEIDLECTCFQKSQETCGCAREKSTKVDIMIRSSRCIDDECGPHGYCDSNTWSGGSASVCVCTGGYRGFDCVDDTDVLSRGKVLRNLLLLTLSNLAFIPTVYIAIRRKYYSEAVVYAAVLLSSTFYHACDGENNAITMCIMRRDVLSFCDFFNAILAIWVTLVAMASYGQKLTSFLQVIGAIIIAMGTILNRRSIWVFLVPATVGCVLIGVAWGRRCRRQHNFRYPATRYRNLYLPTGLCIVFVGLICYAFFETGTSYYLVHSFWHMSVAIGATLLLPNRKHMK